MFKLILNFCFIYLVLFNSNVYSNEDTLLNIDNNTIKYKMVYVKEKIIFPFGANNKEVALNYAYKIGNKEISYKFWYYVYSWAIKNGYNFINEGQMGSNSNDNSKMNKMHPVTNISWLDAVIWTNALTDLYNEKLAKNNKKLIHAYYKKEDNNNLVVLKKPISETKIISVKNASGFRLLNKYEWELAARYIGKTHPATNLDSVTSIKQKNYLEPLNINYYFNLNSISGFYNQKDKEIDDYAWFKNNSNNSTHEVGEKEPNNLGLYDMSGNVWEFIYDQPFVKGGSFQDDKEKIKVSYNLKNSNKNPDNDTGFRISINAN